MPELPEVEVLVRHLAPLLRDKTISAVDVRRAKTLSPTSAQAFKRALKGSRFLDVARRGKYLLFNLQRPDRTKQLVLGHLGMTGRMYVAPAAEPLPKHAAVVLQLGKDNFVFEDTRYFGRLTLDSSPISALGPEPLGLTFTPVAFLASLKRSAQPIKVKLLDQTLVAGVGNIYASEALFRAGISPKIQARRLTSRQAEKLWSTIREVLEEAISLGSTIPLDYAGRKKVDGLFYFGSNGASQKSYEERLLVYDRGGQPCVNCGEPIIRLVQAARSTFYCKHCQR